MNRSIPFIISMFLPVLIFAQEYTHADTLRGSNGPGRQKWDVLHYNITVKPHYDTKTLTGKNIITYLDKGISTMQIDLQEPMQIDSVFHNGKPVNFSREENVYWANVRNLEDALKCKQGEDSLVIFFSGKPKQAKLPPWDGGWIWKKDDNGNPWMSVACQGLGASVWYPCKDIQSDEPNNGATLHIITPPGLVGVGNGRLENVTNLADGSTIFSWKVISPINNYNIVPYIGKYVHFGEKYNGEKGVLDMDYWVLDYNLEKAKEHFKDAPKMMKAFEHWFGPYPFYEDSYKLVESPHLGMEHQSAVAYGNNYKKGYMGKDYSGTGYGKDWDFIIIHESGHEWFGNNITTNDIADMWVHEGFTSYSEALFVDYYKGKEAGNSYAIGLRSNIMNNKPIEGDYGVNKETTQDMYSKAANMIHMIRQIMGDEKFRGMLREMSKVFYHKTVTAADVKIFMLKYAKRHFEKIYVQYLNTTNIPVLEYFTDKGKLYYRFTNCIDGFTMPIVVNGEWIYPNQEWKKSKLKDKQKIIFDPNFYIKTQKKAGKKPALN